MTDPNVIIHGLLDKGAYEEAFSFIVKTYSERLYFHIRRMTRTHEDTNDILQETLVKIWKNLPGFQGRSRIYTWLNRIATNETLTFLRKHNRMKPDGYNDDAMKQLSSDPYFDADEATALLHTAIRLLPPRQQLVFNMRYFDELPFAEISEILDTSVGSLKASYHIAAKKIEEFLRNNTT